MTPTPRSTPAPDVWYDGIDSDCGANDDSDADADGYALAADCDDTNAATHPGAPDAWYDGVDSDCAANDDSDADGDAHTLAADCDDTNAAIYVGAPDAWYDGVDADCAGNDDDDADGDGYPLVDDCDDTDASLFPDVTGHCPVPLVFTVDLGSAVDFAILAKSGVATVPTSAVTGDVGISPAAASAITGFALVLDSSTAYATAGQVTGHVFAANYGGTTPADMTLAVNDMEAAFTEAAGRTPARATDLGAGDIGGMILAPGVYKWGTGLLIPTSVTLSGRASDVWVFQVGQDLTVASATRIILVGGAIPENVTWQVDGLVDIGTTAHLEGVVLSQTSITLRRGASINGRLFAQTAVNLDGSSVIVPAL